MRRGNLYVLSYIYIYVLLPPNPKKARRASALFNPNPSSSPNPNPCPYPNPYPPYPDLNLLSTLSKVARNGSQKQKKGTILLLSRAGGGLRKRAGGVRCHFFVDVLTWNARVHCMHRFLRSHRQEKAVREEALKSKKSTFLTKKRVRTKDSVVVRQSQLQKNKEKA